MKSTARLSKCCVKEMFKSPNVQTSTKPYLAQISQVTNKGTPEKPKHVMVLSDGVYSIRALYTGTETLHDFDVVSVKDYNASSYNGKHYVAIKAMSVVFTDLKGPIGSPVEYKGEDEVSSDIDPVIPQTATLVDTNYRFQGEATDEDEKLILEAVLDEKSRKEETKRPAVVKQTEIDEIPGVRPVSTLGAYSTDWTIKVRLTFKGEPRTFDKGPGKSSGVLLPLEFVDKEGTQIAATIFGTGVHKFNPILEEGKCYYVSKGTVKFANRSHTSIPNEHSITLDEMSEIKPAADDPSIKRSAFNFIPISKVKVMDNGSVVDVIGIVKDPGQKSTTSQNVVKRSVSIYDESMGLINVTLWREFAEKDLSEQQIIGLKNVKISEFNREKQLSTLSNTIIKIDPEDDRLASLKSAIGNKVAPSKQKTKFKEKLRLIAEIANPEELALIDDKKRYYNISGEIVSVSHEKGFFYIACSNCRRKVQGDTCTFCGEDKGTKVTYTFSVQISDGTASIWMHVFGDEGEKLLGRPAEEVKELKERGDPEYKEVFDSIKGKIHSFLVQLKRDEYSGNVKYRYHLVRTKENEWTQENEQLIEKLKRYAENSH